VSRSERAERRGDWRGGRGDGCDTVDHSVSGGHAGLAAALDRLGLSYSVHKVVPFVGTLVPAPRVGAADRVVVFGSYAMWRIAEAEGYHPGVFKLRPFVQKAVWQPFLLNGPGSVFLTVAEILGLLSGDKTWFVRPVSDGKEVSGKVVSEPWLRALSEKVLSLDPDEIPDGSLRHDTQLMLSRPARILKEWRVWIVEDRVVTWSLYKEGARVVYRAEIDDDALGLARDLIAVNPGFAPAYVMDICRTGSGLKLLETNCINAAGFYAADLVGLAAAIDHMAV